MAKNKSKKVNKHVLRAKTLLMKNKATRKDIYNIRNNVSTSELLKFANWAECNKVIRKNLFGDLFPQTYPFVHSSFGLVKVSNEKELFWALERIHCNIDYINIFLSRKKDLYCYLLNSKYDLFEKELENIKNIFGLSLWYIRNKITLIQHTQGLDEQKKYAEMVRNESLPSGITDFLTYYFSYQAEKAVSAVTYINAIDNIVDNEGVDSSFNSYIKYHLLNEIPNDIDELCEILAIANGSPLIDFYEAVANLAIPICSFLRRETLIRSDRYLTDIVEKINDDRLRPLITFLNENIKINLTKDKILLASFKNYISGQCANAFDILNTSSYDKSSSFEQIEMFARAMASSQLATTQNNLFSDIAKKICLIMLDDENSKFVAEDLIKTYLSYPLSEWNASIKNLIFSEFDIKISSKNTVINSDHIFSFESFSPLLFYKKISTKFKKEILNRIIFDIEFFCIKKWCYIQIGEDIPDEEICISDNEMNLISIKKHLHECNFENLAEATNVLPENQNRYYYISSICARIHSLMMLKQSVAGAIAMANYYLANQNSQNMLSLPSISTCPDILLKNSNEICVPIIFDMYFKKVGSELEHYRRYAYEDFLLSHKATKPTDLQNSVDTFDRNQIIYFFRYVCVESVMDTSLAFTSSHDVLTERINICRLLASIDNINEQSYHAEVKDILKKISIAKKIREIEKSKIYVDIENLTLVAKKKFKEQYDRYLAFIKGGYSSRIVEARERIQKLAKSGQFEQIFSIILPEDETTSLFQRIIVEIRDLFVSNSEHGLDGYLSVRIRHGTFSAHLRSPLESEFLITQKDSVTNKYKENIYWKDNTQNLSGEQQDILQDVLSKFSEKYDGLIQKIIKEWIQINTTNKEGGLFNFALISQEVEIIRSEVTQDLNIDDFLSKVFLHLISRLEGALEEIRKKLTTEANDYAKLLIEELEAEVLKFGDAFGIRQLKNAIGKARTNVQLAFNRVSEWFFLQTNADNEPFKIEEIVDISKETVKIFCPDFEVECIIHKPLDKILIGDKLASFVDVFFIVFQNIIKHSGIENNPIASVDINLKNKIITVRIVSKAIESAYSSLNLEKIQKIKKDIASRTYGDALGKEGGTGFYKLNKILSTDLRGPKLDDIQRLDFGFIDSNNFFVEFKVPVMWRDK